MTKPAPTPRPTDGWTREATDPHTLIEWCVRAVIVLIVLGVSMATAIAAFAQTATSTVPGNHVNVSVEATDLAGILAGLAALVALLFRNAAVRAFIPMLVEAATDKLRERKERRARRKRKAGQ